MILQALNDYYSRMSHDPSSGMPRQGFSEENLSFALSLRPDGTLARVVDLRIGDKKPKPRRMLVPAAVKRTVGIDPNFLWDNTGYVLGVDGKGKPERTQKTFAAFYELHRKAAEGSDHSGLKAVCAFLSQWNPETFFSLDQADILLDQNCVFMWDETADYIHDMPGVDRPERGREENDTAWCLVSGRQASIAQLHPSINGVWGAQSSGAALVSFNQDAFTSYGKEQSLNAPVSEDAAFAYTTALNYLLRLRRRKTDDSDSPDGNERVRCIQIGDASTVFWAERASPAEDWLEALFSTPAEVKEDAEDVRTTTQLHSMLDALRKGRPIEEALPEIDPSARFFILGLSPNAARIALRFWHVTTFGDLARNIADHAEAFSVKPQYDRQPKYPTLWQLLIETAVQGKSKNIPPSLAGALTRSVLMGIPYPHSLYAAVLSRIRADKEVSYFRAGLIKAYLVRNLKQEVSYMLDENRPDVSYRLGRLFALLEKVQLDAQGNVNATIRDRYIGSASATPGVVFPQLLRLAQHHIAKSEYGRIIDRRIQNVMETIDGFPAHLSQEDQGTFFIGYYHQRSANYQKSSTEKE